MKTSNFPAKVLARQQRALARMKGPNQTQFTDKVEYEIAMERYTTNRTNLEKAIGSVYGNPLAIRTKKNRSDRAKVR